METSEVPATAQGVVAVDAPVEVPRSSRDTNSGRIRVITDYRGFDRGRER